MNNKIRLSEISKKQLASLIVRWCNMERLAVVHKTIGISRDLCYKWKAEDSVWFSEDMAYNIAVALEVNTEDLFAFLYGNIEFEKFWQTTKYKKRPFKTEVELEEIEEKKPPSPVLMAFLDYWELLSGSDRDILRNRLGVIKQSAPYYYFPLVRFTNGSQYQLAQTVIKMSKGNTPLAEWLKAGVKPEVLDIFFNSLRSDVVTIVTRHWSAEDLYPLLCKVKRINAVKGTAIELDKHTHYGNDIDLFFYHCDHFSHPNKRKIMADFINQKIVENDLKQETINLRLNAFDLDLNRWRSIRFGNANPSKRELYYLKAIIEPLGDIKDWEEILVDARIETETQVLHFGKQYAIS